jgi:hypothetical protein
MGCPLAFQGKDRNVLTPFLRGSTRSPPIPRQQGQSKKKSFRPRTMINDSIVECGLQI